MWVPEQSKVVEGSTARLLDELTTKHVEGRENRRCGEGGGVTPFQFRNWTFPRKGNESL